MRTLACLLVVLLSLPVAAEVYKWVDEKGVIHYTDQPPSKNAKPAKLPVLQTYEAGALPALEQVAAPDKEAAEPAPWEVKILSPSPEQTFRGEAQGQVPVAVAVSPGLLDGQQLVYYLNGAVQGSPNPSTSYTLSGLERGAHTVAVGLVNAAGQELARSATVTVHMKPPIVKP